MREKSRPLSLLQSCCVLLIVDCSAGSEIAASNQVRGISISPEQGQFDPNECFDKVWQIINEEFWDPNFNGVDWETARKRYRPRAVAAYDHEAFALVVNQMLGELKTSHTRYLTRWDAEYYSLKAALISGDLKEGDTSDTAVADKRPRQLHSFKDEPHRTGIGVVTKKVDGRHYVIAALASSAAREAGIVLGDWIVHVNGKPFHPIRSFENTNGQKLELTIQRNPSRASRRKLQVTPVCTNEREMFENDAFEGSERPIEYRGHHFSYIRLWWLMGWNMRGVFEAGTRYHETEGIIIDIRDGYGGSPAAEYVHPFLKGGLETITQEFIARRHAGQCIVAYGKPVVVLINAGSRSGKELLAYYFKKTKAGLLIGERTAGYVCGGSYKRICEESMLLYCAAMVVVDGRRLEGVGVDPDIEVPFDIRFAEGRDVQLERAKDEMVRLIESGRN